VNTCNYRLYLDISWYMRLLQAQSFLQVLASESSGQAWFPRFPSAFPDVMRRIVQNITLQCRLVYVPQVPRYGISQDQG
jgi:hypothetical protein